MSSESSSLVEDVKDAIASKFHDLPASTGLPASTYSETVEESPQPIKSRLLLASTYSEMVEESPQPIKSRLFNRQRSLHQIFGGGKAADAFLWRDKFLSGSILAASTIAYFVLEHSGCTLLTIVSNILLVTLGVLFVWSNAAVFLNRSPPPLPDLHISEEAANSLALALRVEINKILAIARDVALGKDFKLFLKVMAILWGLTIVGGWFHFLTLVYLGVLLSHTIPVIYETYEDQIELYAKQGFEQAQKQYKKVDETVFSKIFNALPKLRKTD